ncbi:MAG TPA: Rv3235 family protein [Mycobacteriales bacterium]|nr:Rv3235 family protein [Mycobacteriales bacterium]
MPSSHTQTAHHPPRACGPAFRISRPNIEPPLEDAPPNGCPTCGHTPDRAEALAPVEVGPLTRDVPRDADAVTAARRGLQAILEAAVGRRSFAQVGGHADHRVLAYLKQIEPACARAGSISLRRFHAAQPHEGAVEVTALVELGRPRALAARFELAELDLWKCTALRIL